METKEFIKHYWKYYLNLESQIVKTFQYSTLDKINSKNFSLEYIKQLQIICSEIDVLCKAYCELLENEETDTIAKYASIITRLKPDIKVRIVKCKENNEIEYIPFSTWEYSVNIDKKGVKKINGTPPSWWSVYNKVKHNRMSMNQANKVENYKLANQENVMNAIAGLYLLEMYFYKDLAIAESSEIPNFPYPTSNMFDLENWANGKLINEDLYIEF